MGGISEILRAELLSHGADIVGFGDMSAVPPELRRGLPVGVSVAVKYPKDVIRGIAELPTAEYFAHYNALNEKLDRIVTRGAELLRGAGYEAIPQTLEYVGRTGHDYGSDTVPHKTFATRAGIGWIGKCALLVTREYGSMIRLSSILTDAPLDTAEPIDRSLCGECEVCKKACPAGAVSGRLWSVDLYRDEFFDAVKCRATAQERSRLGFGGGDSHNGTICGRCIYVCPHTQGYLRDESR
jgi:epoxyqueuosine reductase QueG